MFKITEKEFKKFINELRTKRILIIGEIHGVKENITVLKELIKIIGKKEKNNNIYISLEWPYKLQRQVNNFLQGRISIGEFENYLKKFDYGDGRITKEHVNFLKKLSIENRRIYIWCLDKDEKDWNKRDKTMYKRWKNLNKNIHYGYHFIIVGNLHARKASFKQNRKLFKPFASYFKKSIVMILKYRYGEFYNLGVKKIDSRALPQKSLIKTNTKFFDWELILPKATPSK